MTLAPPLARLAALVVPALALGACQPPPRGPEPAVDTHTVIYNMSDQPRFIDPALNYQISGGNVTAHCFEGLTAVGPSAEIVPGVAERWEISPDGLTYDFHLRSNACWSDGRPVTAEDFRYAWVRVLRPETTAAYALFLYAIVNAEQFNRGEITDPSQLGIDVIDDHHLRVRLTRPVPYLLQMMTFSTYMPARRDIIEADPDGWTHQAGTYIGNGAFMLTAYERGHVMEFAPNPHHWARDTVHIDRLVFLMISEGQAEYVAYRTGQLDVSYGIPYSDVPEIRRSLSDHLVITPWIGTYYLLFNFERAPFDDVRVRRAFMLSYDRARLTNEVTENIRRPAFTFIPPGVKDADGVTDFCEVGGPLIPNQATDEARQLLEEAGYPGGRGLPHVLYLYNTGETHRQVAERLQADWRNVLGVTVELTNQEAQVWSANMDEGNYQVARTSWFGDYSDPMTFLDLFLSNNPNNRARYANPEYDELVHRAMHTADTAEYFRLCHEAEQLLLRDAVVAPVWYYSNEFLMSPALEGLVCPPTGGTYFHHIRWNLDRLRQAGLEVDE